MFPKGLNETNILFAFKHLVYSKRFVETLVISSNFIKFAKLFGVIAVEPVLFANLIDYLIIF